MSNEPSADAGAAGTPVPDTICALPWINLSLDVDGSTRPCCKFVHGAESSSYPFANLRDASLAELWHSPAMRQLRRDFRAGHRPVECSTCWDEEAAGIPSYRQTFAEYRDITAEVDFDDDRPPAPAALDLKLSNVCNLKCRICGPVASSLWLQEELSVGKAEPGSFIARLEDDRTYYRSNKITRVPENAATFRTWLDSLEYLEFTGGEPMLSPENRELIELIATEGRPERVGVLFNTNATTIDERILRHLGAFREVSACLSIDDVGGRFEYERAPAEWADVEATLARYQERAEPAWQLYAFCSVSIFNAWYLPEYVRWLASRSDRIALQPTLNLVHYPRHFSIQVLPPAIKAAVAERLRREILDDPATPQRIVGAVADVVHFMEGHRPDDAENWRTGLRIIAERDAIRGQRFADVFPEFATLLADLDPGGTPVAIS